MNILYLECNMGAAGDMLTAALLELIDDPDAFLRTMNGAGIPGTHIAREERTTAGVRGTHISVTVGGAEEVSDDVDRDSCGAHCHHDGCEAHHHHDHDECGAHHHHAGLADVRTIVDALKLPDAVKADVMGVYGLIAEAEAFAHGSEIEKIHFHEVGMMDAVADVANVCMLMRMIGADRVVVSPVCTGYGEVRCMHGIIPVPSPATAYLLRGVPCYAGRTRAELLTPTGAALLRYFANEFAQMPEMRVRRVGCGLGTKEFETANCVRAMLGDTDTQTERVSELKCNLDDMTAEQIGYATELLLENGALDAYCVPILMKKNRPATMLCCLCRPSDEARFVQLLLAHTTTLGVRVSRMERYVLARETRTVCTEYGDIPIKVSRGEGIEKAKPEYDACAEAAKRANVPIDRVMRAAEAAYRA